MINAIYQIAEFKNPETLKFFSNIQQHRVIYQKWSAKKLNGPVKEIIEVIV